MAASAITLLLIGGEAQAALAHAPHYRLYLSPLTTKTHVSHIMTKLAARDRAQLVVIAYETGLVVPGVTA